MARYGWLCIILILVGCSTDELTSERLPTQTRSAADQNRIDDGGDAGDDGSIDGTGDDGGSDANSDDGGDGLGSDGGDDSTGGTGADDAAANLTYFEDEVVPRFASSCAGCHADPRFMVEVQAPLTIFAYDRMRAMALRGDSASNNDLINKIQGIVQHAGGDRCPSGLDVAPCNVVVEWAKRERGETTGGTTARVGELVAVTDMGRVTGWAIDGADTNATTTVRLYIDGPSGTGTLATEAPANLTGFDNGNGNRHAFAVTLPEIHRDGTTRTLYAYTVSNGQEVLLPGSPKEFAAYAYSDGGRTFFDNTVRPQLINRCGGCHAISYEQQFANLLQPSPAKGGTALNNLLINKPSGRAAHGGGNLCGGANGAPCQQIQDWWNLEFN